MLLFSLLLISAIGGAAHLKDLKYLIDNGREVEGKVVRYTKGRAYSNSNGFTYVVFRLYYEYEENDVTYKDDNVWQIREKYTEKVEERESWCKSQVGKSVKLIIADNGYCKVAEDLKPDYKAQHDFVWIRGGICLGAEGLLLIVLLVIIFKVKVKGHLDRV